MSKLNFNKLVRGHYEAEWCPKNSTSKAFVPDFAFNILSPMGLLYKPVADENHLAEGGAKPEWPDKKSFAACLTHDVDAVSQFSLAQTARMRPKYLLGRRSLKSTIKGSFIYSFNILQAIRHSSIHDPFHCLERWLEIEEKVGARSTFFFWPGWKAINKHHFSDCLYDMEDKIVFDGQKCTVAEMIREINRRGWEIGLHSSWYSYDDVDEIKRQKEALEKVLDHDIVSVRQHFLHYDIRVTPRIHAKAGFKYDSTLGFNDNVGFRFGTCYPHKLFDLQAEEELPIVEVPLIIQDGAMLNPDKGMRLNEETAYQYVKQITEAVENVGGVLTLLWHPNKIVHPDWWNLYLRTLEYLKERDVWFGTVREVGSIFTKESQVL